jgi:hypothetical protein
MAKPKQSMPYFSQVRTRANNTKNIAKLIYEIIARTIVTNPEPGPYKKANPKGKRKNEEQSKTQAFGSAIPFIPITSKNAPNSMPK